MPPLCKLNMAEWEDYPLHECVFKGDLRQLSQLLRVHDVSQKDVHGKKY